MLKFASFDFTQEKELNELLAKFPIANGRSFLISDGRVLVPYEDGEDAPVAHQIIALKMDKDTILAQKEVVVHSQKVNKALLADLKESAEAAHALHENNRSNKVLEGKYREAQNAYDQLENLSLMNEAEIRRLDFNIGAYDERIAVLRGEKEA